MSEILDVYKTKKGKKEFEKLSEDAKAKVIEAILMEAIRLVMKNEIPKAMIKGEEMAYEHIYNNYVSNIDSFEKMTSDWISHVEVLLSYIRVKHINYLAKQIDAEKDDNNET